MIVHGRRTNKKVLLRERKRHTDRDVSSTPSAVLSGGRGTPSLAKVGTRPSVFGQGTSSLCVNRQTPVKTSHFVLRMQSVIIGSQLKCGWKCLVHINEKC